MACSRIATTLFILFSIASAYASLSSTPILEFRETNYTKLQQNVTYKSTKSFDIKGMQPLYNITNMVLDFFLGDEPIAEGK